MQITTNYPLMNNKDADLDVELSFRALVSRAMDEAGDNFKKRKQACEAADIHHSTGNNSHMAAGIMRSFRDLPPAHFTLRIDKFSLFLKTVFDNYESQIFEAGGYKWRLILYPSGNKKRNIKNYISLYLSIVDTGRSPLFSRGWEVSVYYKLFVFNQLRDKYLTIQDANGEVKRFRNTKMDWGFDQLLPSSTFNNVSNGYLVDDCCTFGAEVFVITSSGVGECVSTLAYPANNTYTWKINMYSAIKEVVCSETFVAAAQSCREMLLYPKGYNDAEGKQLSLFIRCPVNMKTVLPQRKIYAECKLRVIDQIGGKHMEKTGNIQFIPSGSWGFSMLTLEELNSETNGYKVNDTVIVEAQFTHISTSKGFVI